jgi:hypothetical protein
MAVGRGVRYPALLGALILLAVAGGTVWWGTRGGDIVTGTACPRSHGPTQLAALLLWEDAGGSLAPAPEVRRFSTDDLRPLTDPGDAESCRQLLATLPDTLAAGAHGPYLLGLYQVGDLYIVAIVPRSSPAEAEAIARGDEVAERPGATRIYGGDFRLIETYRH